MYQLDIVSDEYNQKAYTLKISYHGNSEIQERIVAKANAETVALLYFAPFFIKIWQLVPCHGEFDTINDTLQKHKLADILTNNAVIQLNSYSQAIKSQKQLSRILNSYYAKIHKEYVNVAEDRDKLYQ